jgi:DNA-binding NarL/FixJ family response regulator
MELRIALCDDHKLFADAFCALLATVPDLKLVGQATDGREAIGLLETVHPEIFLMDVSLPGITGIAVTRELVHRDPFSKVIILTAHPGHDFATQALSAGARGFVLKEQPWPTVLEAIRTVARGGIYVAPGIARWVMEQKRTRRGARSGLGGALDELTVREREIFDLLVLGLHNHRIAKELTISVKTVETHRTKINRKLRVHSTAELVRFAAVRGLVPQIQGLGGVVKTTPSDECARESGTMPIEAAAVDALSYGAAGNVSNS